MVFFFFLNLHFIYKPCGFPKPQICIFITLMDALVKEVNAYSKKFSGSVQSRTEGLLHIFIFLPKSG